MEPLQYVQRTNGNTSNNLQDNENTSIPYTRKWNYLTTNKHIPCISSHLKDVLEPLKQSPMSAYMLVHLTYQCSMQ